MSSSKYALLVGCNYTNVPSCTLHGCIDDIVNMSTALAQMGYSSNNIVMLRDDSSDPALLPTKANILAQLQSLIAKSANTGTTEIWFHYSGHGTQVTDRNRDEVSGLDGCIVPMDFLDQGFIIDDDLFTIFNGSKCPTMILTDSCFSGTVCDLPYSIEYVRGNTYRYTQNNTAKMTNTKVVMISGCKDTQTSADIYDYQQSEYEGAFTDAFVRSLGATSYRGSLGTVYVNTVSWLRQNGFDQIPILSSSVATPSWSFGGNNVPVAPSAPVVSTSSSKPNRRRNPKRRMVLF